MQSLLYLSLLLVIGLPCAAHAAEFHVAPAGAAANPGTEGRPFATLEQARDAVRKLRQQNGGRLREPLTVRVQSGTYTLAAPFALAPEDSGTKECPVTYCAAAGATPVFSGGRGIDGWKEETVGGNKLWTTELPDVRSGKWYFHQLWVNGERRTRARHPNKGAFKIAAHPGVTDKTPRYPGQDMFQYAPGDLKSYRNLEDVDVVALHLWVSVRLAVKGIDEKERIVRFRGKSRRTLMDGDEPARYYVENALELLDSPGEWYLDRSSGRLYYWPLPGERADAVEAVAPVLPQLVRFEGRPEKGEYVEHVVLKRLTFAHADWWPARDNTMDSQAAVEAVALLHGDGVKNCRIEGCRVAHGSGYGIHLERGCQGNVIEACTVHDLGAGGVRVGETGQRQEARERTFGNEVVGNELHRLGEVFHQAVGVWVGQSYGNRVVNNHIYDLYYTGMSCGWTWGYGPTLARDNVFEYNRVHDVGKGLLSDMGGIYTLGKQPGTVIRHNVFHDIDAYRYGGWGIYFDEGSSEIVAENNLVYRTKHGGFHQHYGKENVVRNNIFAFGKEAQVQRTRVEPHTSFTFEKNIVYWDSGNLLAGNWSQLNVTFDRNLYWKVGGGDIRFANWTWKEWQAKGMDVHSRIADPMFADPRDGDFSLPTGSPAFDVGFEPFAVPGVGPAKQ